MKNKVFLLVFILIIILAFSGCRSLSEAIMSGGTGKWP